VRLYRSKASAMAASMKAAIGQRFGRTLYVLLQIRSARHLTGEAGLLVASVCWTFSIGLCGWWQRVAAVPRRTYLTPRNTHQRKFRTDVAHRLNLEGEYHS
jgi:hypothetical protein